MIKDTSTRIMKNTSVSEEDIDFGYFYFRGRLRKKYHHPNYYTVIKTTVSEEATTFGFQGRKNKSKEFKSFAKTKSRELKSLTNLKSRELKSLTTQE